MTWTAAADAAMPACARAAAAPTADIVTGWTAAAATGPACRGPVQRPARGFAGVRVASHGPDAAPTAARGPGRHPSRPVRAGLPRPGCPAGLPRLGCPAGLPRQREPGCVRRPHLLGADLTTVGWPSDPGREVL
jgi:hypothetical protein